MNRLPFTFSRLRRIFHPNQHKHYCVSKDTFYIDAQDRLLLRNIERYPELQGDVG